MASTRKIVDGDFGLRGRIIQNNSRGRKIMLEGVNDKRGVNMQADDVSTKCRMGKHNLPTLPITYFKDNVFFLKLCQRAILHPIVKFPRGQCN